MNHKIVHETVRELHNEAIQKAEVKLLKDQEIATHCRLALSLMFQLHQKLYDEENHLDALWQDVKQVSPINEY